MDNQEFKLSAILSIDIPDLSFSDEDEENTGSIEACHHLIEAASLSHKGNLVKAIGDSFIISFDNCQDAVKCAMDIASQLSSGIASTMRHSPQLRARMGIHLGDVRFFEKNVFGDAVDIASALQAAARPGSICVSGEVLSLVREKITLDTSLLSEQRHKALPAGLKAYEIHFAAASGTEPSPGGRESGEKGPTLEEIRKAVLEEIRVQGRRLTVDEAMRKFSWYGVEATEVIAALAESGILIGKAAASAAGRASMAGQTESYAKASDDTGGRDDYRGREAPGYSSANAAGDLGKSIETAIHSIVSEIERAVDTSYKGGHQRADESAGTGLHIRLDKDSFKESAMSLKEVGREIRRQVRESRHAERHGERRSNRGSSASRSSEYSTAAFDKYRADLSKKAGRLGKGIVGGIISFMIVNAGLWFLNLNYSKDFPWAAIVSIFWGFGLVDSIFSAIRVSRQAREADSLPELDDSQTKELKAIHRERDSIGKHFLSTLSIPSALWLVNMAADPGNPWFIIPSAILAATFVIHFITYVATAPARSRRFFEKLGIRGNRRGLDEARKKREATTTGLGAYADIYRDAQDSAADIGSSLSSSDPSAAAEMKPQLDGYLNQVLLLAKTANELDTIIGEIPMEALKKDKVALKAKLESSKEGMRFEYEGSIKEIEKQEESFKALAEQREVIDLRLRSSVSQLQQLKMDLARAKAADTETDTGRKESALSSIRARSEELSRYIDDLKEGNLEALADPFIELEKKYGDGAALPPSASGSP